MSALSLGRREGARRGPASAADHQRVALPRQPVPDLILVAAEGEQLGLDHPEEEVEAGLGTVEARQAEPVALPRS